MHTHLDRLRRESLLEAVGYDPSSVHELRELVEVLRTQVETLRAELEEAHAANRENRCIITALTQRIPELETPSEQAPPQGPPGDSEEIAEEPEGEGPTDYWRRSGQRRARHVVEGVRILAGRLNGGSQDGGDRVVQR